MSTRDHQFISQLGATFFLTSSIIGWKHVFIKSTLLDTLIKCIAFYQDKRNVRTVGYCLMPNHIQDKKMDAIWVLRQKLDYIHYNPLQHHWELVTDAVSYTITRKVFDFFYMRMKI